MHPQKIVKIEKIGKRPTVDIEIDSPIHIFYGNGIATSNSHAVSYAVNAYLSAFAKAHFPQIFFASYLRFAKDKIDPKAEIKELVQNANEMDINICIPDLRHLNKHFILKNNCIYFGLTDIKSFGDSVFNKLLKIVNDNKLSIQNMNWIQILFKVLLNINSVAAKALIKSGALTFCNKTRTAMLFEYDIASSFTKTETEYVSSLIDSNTSLESILLLLKDKSRTTQKRKNAILSLVNTLYHPPYSLEDNPEWIADSEEESLGCSITCSKVDMYDVSMTNCNCKEFKTSLSKDNFIICGEIETISITKTKTGKNPGSEMAFISLSDGYGHIDSVIFFPENYKKYRNILFNNNVIVVQGNKSKQGDSLLVEKAYIPRA